MTKPPFKLHPHQVACMEQLKKLGPTMVIEFPIMSSGLSIPQTRAEAIKKSKALVKVLVKPKKDS